MRRLVRLLISILMIITYCNAVNALGTDKQVEAVYREGNLKNIVNISVSK